VYPVSRRFLASLSRTPRWARVVEWSLDGRTWQPAVLHAGRVAQDTTDQARWSLNATISGVTVGRGALTPFGVLLRAKVGMVFAPDDIEWVPMGTYRCEETVRGIRGGKVTVDAASLEAAVIDAEYLTPRILPQDSSSNIVASQIREVIPSASVSWGLPDPIQPRLATGLSRWAVIDGATNDPSIARALAGRVFCDRNGSFVAAPVPTIADDPVWVVEQGPGGVLIDSSERLSRKDSFNVVVVTGESTDSGAAPVGPAIAQDNDPTSPTYAGGDPLLGGFGQSVFRYTSSRITTDDQAAEAAVALLAPGLGLQQQIDWQSAVNPALDVGDVVLARNPSGLTPTILDRIELDLATMKQTGNCRAGTTRLLGDTSSLPTSEEGS
jgi:hypothetical protein